MQREKVRDRPRRPVQAGKGDVGQIGALIWRDADYIAGAINLVVQGLEIVMRCDARPEGVYPATPVKNADRIEGKGEGRAANATQRGSYILRTMAVDLSDEAKRQVQLRIVLPPCALNPTHDRTELLPDGGGRANGDEQAMHKDN